MKRVHLIVAVLLVLFITTTVAMTPSALPEDVISRLDIKYDKFAGSTSIRPAGLDYGGNSIAQIYLTIQETSEYKYCFLNVAYLGKSWRFIERIVFLVGDERFELKPALDVHRSVLESGSVLELMGFSAGLGGEAEDVVKTIYRAAINRTPVEFKVYDSKGGITGIFTKPQLQAWQDILDYYMAIDKP